MASNPSEWWTDERVDATVTSQYVHSHLRPSEAEQLTKSVFGDLSDDTYLEWILTRSKRFFLTLVEAGVPDQIFGVIDDSWDDEDLPIPEDEVPGLLLSPEPDRVLDRRFYRAQFKYLIRVVGDGEHIRYAQEETIPVSTLGLKSILGKAKDGLEKAKLPSDSRRVFARKRILLANQRMEEDLLAEMAEWRIFAHEHILSVYGSYTATNYLYVLMTPSPEHTLKSFLNDPPKAFEALSKPVRRKTVLHWTHCLANGLAWLHSNSKNHGAIRPSRILIDDSHRIYLGQFDGTGILCDSTVKDDIEAYQYAAPERWKRSVTIQTTGNSRTALPSGGRTGRRHTNDLTRSLSGDGEDEYSSIHSQRLSLERPTSVSYAFSPTSKNGSRLRLGSFKDSTMKAGNALKRSNSQRMSMMDGLRPTRSSLEDHAQPGAASALSSGSQDNAKARRHTGRIYAAASEMRTAVVQTWASAQHDQLAADIFSLGAILMEIITFLCKHSSSSFSRYRATKNKSAGRGGGLADASFHANIGQVFSWADTLQNDANKRIKKEDGTIFKAVGPCLQVVMQCLERDPASRLPAVDLQRKLGDHIRDFAGIEILQCCLSGEADRSEEKLRSKSTRMEVLRQTAGSRPQLPRSESKGKSHADSRGSNKSVFSSFSPRMDSLTPRSSPLTTTNVGFDDYNATDTLVESSQKGEERSREKPDYDTDTAEGPMHILIRPPTADSSSTMKLLNRHLEKADQSPIPSPALRSFRNTYQSSTTASSVISSTIGGTSDDFYSTYSYTPPPSAHPTRELPPIPRSASSKNPPRSTPHNFRPTSQLMQHPSSDSSTTALPTLPTVGKRSPSDLPSSSNSSTSNHNGTNGRKPTSRTNDVEEASPTETNPRHYRRPSQGGLLNENKLYVSHLGKDRFTLRGLQHP